MASSREEQANFSLISSHCSSLQTEITKKPDAYGNGNYKVICQVKCIITLADKSFKSDVGTCCGEMGDFASAVDTSKKGAYTDALKRSARKFGRYLGSCLYETKESARKAAPKSETERQKQIDEKVERAERRAMGEGSRPSSALSMPAPGGGNSGTVTNIQHHQRSAPVPISAPPKPPPQNHYHPPVGQQPTSAAAATAARVPYPPRPPAPSPSAPIPNGPHGAYSTGFNPSPHPPSAKAAGGGPAPAPQQQGGAPGIKRPAAGAPTNPYGVKRSK